MNQAILYSVGDLFVLLLTSSKIRLLANDAMGGAKNPLENHVQ